MNQDIKREIILSNVSNPYHKEIKDKNEYQYINTNNQSCIDNLDLFVKMDNNFIKEIYFAGEACAISTSTTSIMAKLLENKSKEEALEIIDNYLKMINEEAYDETILKDSLVYSDIYKQPNRKKCATLTWYGMKELLERVGE